MSTLFILASASALLTGHIGPAASGSIPITFGPGRTLQTSVIGPIGGASVIPLGGGAPVGMAVALNQTGGGVPMIAYKVTRETFASAPLCPSGPTAAIVVAYPARGPQTIAAIAGDIPGNPGSRICALYPAAINQAASSEQGYQ